jgi:hypothetical protein
MRMGGLLSQKSQRKNKVNGSRSKQNGIVSHFFFDTRGAKKKFTKRNAKDFALCGARPKAPPLETASFLKKT